MRGKYIGRDGSMGFRTGQTYEISTELTGEVRKPTPLGVGWIALLIYTLLCIFLFFYTHSVLYYYYGKQI